MGYPKVKVRPQADQDDQPAHVAPLVHFSSPEKEHQDVSPPTVARIPESYVASVVMPSISVPEGEKKDNKIEEMNRQNIRASSIPRPRAVLSSPDNDTVIGNKNKIKADRPSALKNHNLVKNRHAQSVPCHLTILTGKSTKTNKCKESSDENPLTGRKGSGITLPCQRRPTRTGNPCSVRNQVS